MGEAGAFASEQSDARGSRSKSGRPVGRRWRGKLGCEQTAPHTLPCLAVEIWPTCALLRLLPAHQQPQQCALAGAWWEQSRRLAAVSVGKCTRARSCSLHLQMPSTRQRHGCLQAALGSAARNPPLGPMMATRSPRSITRSAKHGGEDSGVHGSAMSVAVLHATTQAVHGMWKLCFPACHQTGSHGVSIPTCILEQLLSVVAVCEVLDAHSHLAHVLHRRELEGPGGSNAEWGGVKLPALQRKPHIAGTAKLLGRSRAGKPPPARRQGKTQPKHPHPAASQLKQYRPCLPTQPRPLTASWAQTASPHTCHLP